MRNIRYFKSIKKKKREYEELGLFCEKNIIYFQILSSFANACFAFVAYFILAEKSASYSVIIACLGFLSLAFTAIGFVNLYKLKKGIKNK